MTTTRATAELKAIRDAQRAAQSLAQVEHDLRDRHTAMVAERGTVAKLLRPREEVLADMRRLVTDHAQQWASQNAGLVTLAFAGHIDTSAGHEARAVYRKPHLPELYTSATQPGVLTVRDLIGLAPAAVMAQFEACIHAMPADRFGLPKDRRTQRLADLDAQISDLERQHTEIVDAAAEVGIEMTLLAPVAARRAEVAREAERTRLLNDARAKGPQA